MEKAFREYLRKGFTAKLKSAAPKFAVDKKAKFFGDLAGSLALRWDTPSGLRIWIVMHFVKDRSYLHARLYWAAKPELDVSELTQAAIDFRRRRRSQSTSISLGDYLELGEGMLDSSDFEPGRDTLPMATKYPPRDRIRPIMATAEAQKILKLMDLEGSKWEGSDGTDDWYSIISYGKQDLTEADAEIAVGSTLKSFLEIVERDFLPFSEKLAARGVLTGKP